MKITHKINQVTLVAGFGIIMGSFTRVGWSLVSKNKDEGKKQGDCLTGTNQAAQIMLFQK